MKDTRRLIRISLRYKIPGSEEKASLNFSLEVSRIQQMLKEMPYLKYKMDFMNPLRSAGIKKKGQEWARQDM